LQSPINFPLMTLSGLSFSECALVKPSPGKPKEQAGARTFFVRSGSPVYHWE